MMFIQDKIHTYILMFLMLKDETIGMRQYQFDILQRLRLIS